MTRGGFLLGVIDPSVLPLLAARGQRRVVMAGDVLIRQGDPAGSMYVTIDGRLRVERWVPGRAASPPGGRRAG